MFWPWWGERRAGGGGGGGDERGPAAAAELRAALHHHGHCYYVLHDAEISDDAYDGLLDELRALEAGHPS